MFGFLGANGGGVKREPAGGVTKWGENSEKNYGDYVDFLVKNGVLKEKTPTLDLITNDLIDEINRFDQAEIVALAKK